MHFIFDRAGVEFTPIVRQNILFVCVFFFRNSYKRGGDKYIIICKYTNFFFFCEQSSPYYFTERIPDVCIVSNVTRGIIALLLVLLVYRCMLLPKNSRIWREKKKKKTRIRTVCAATKTRKRVTRNPLIRLGTIWKISLYRHFFFLPSSILFPNRSTPIVRARAVKISLHKLPRGAYNAV